MPWHHGDHLAAREWERAVLFGLVEQPSRWRVAIAALRRLVLAVPVALLAMLGAPAAAALANTYFVSNANDSGQGSLRSAMQQANNHAGADTITVTPGLGQLMIEPRTPLPPLTNTVTFNGDGLIAVNDTFTKGFALTLAGGSGGSTLEGVTVYGGGLLVKSPSNLMEHEGIYYFFKHTDGKHGLVVQSGNNTVGGSAVFGISGGGIVIHPPSGGAVARNLIVANTIGTDAGGDGGLGNLGGGVLLLGNASNNTIGGSAAGDGNVISGNGGPGVSLQGGGARGNLIEGNTIGLTPSGSSALPNTWGGVLNLGASNDTFTLNTVSGNTDGGLLLDGKGTSHNLVRGNLIGIGAGGAALGNDGPGVTVEGGATLNTIGGSLRRQGNQIGFNLGGGVLLTGPTTSGDALLSNLIFSNGHNRSGPGITLAQGAEGRIGRPVIDSLTTSGGVVRITGTSAPNATVQAFANGSCSDPEGRTLLGTTHANASGKWTLMPLTTLPSGTGVTAVQTTAHGDSSSFSACVSAP